MPDIKELQEDFLQFIRERRSDESHFAELSNKLEEVITTANSQHANGSNFVDRLKEVQEKQAAIYAQAKEKQGTAWPEYEKFITQLESILVDKQKI